ncbi:MAG TPA: polysaccharide biosynthesis/export family protein [Candidatus Aquilonibacter sp.]|nr:polysaccharide biosynthesis/export family protein [Candidatus Aquilonibacter sp.]
MGTQATGKLVLSITLSALVLLAAAVGSRVSAAPAPQRAGSATASSLLTQNSTANGDLARRDDGRYRLAASDTIALTFPLTPEFNQTVNIEPDGFGSLAGAGSVHLEGMTTDEAASAIRAAYGKLLRDPIVSIELKDFNKPYFVINGQVNKPGKYDLRGYTSASEAVAEAGGFNDEAKHSQVLLFRRVNDQWYEVRSLDMKKILSGHDLNEDAQIEPGDMLFVPQNFISKVRRFIPSSGFGAYYQLHP